MRTYFKLINIVESGTHEGFNYKCGDVVEDMEKIEWDSEFEIIEEMSYLCQFEDVYVFSKVNVPTGIDDIRGLIYNEPQTILVALDQLCDARYFGINEYQEEIHEETLIAPELSELLDVKDQTGEPISIDLDRLRIEYNLYGENIIENDDTLKDFAMSIFKNVPFYFPIYDGEDEDDIKENMMKSVPSIINDDISRTEINYQELLHCYRFDIGDLLYEIDNEGFEIPELAYFGDGAIECFNTLVYLYIHIHFNELKDVVEKDS